MGLCGAHYQQKKTYGAPIPGRPIGVKRPRNLTPEQVFALNLPRHRGAGECWDWQGTMAAVGYGQVVIDGRGVYAHRLAFELANGRTLAPDEQVRHSCDNRRCVNPRHLGVGSFYDNMQDAIERNRFRHTESHWNAKLTADEVRMIRKLGAAGIRHQTIAETYGVCRSAVTNIVNRKAWRQI